MVSSHLDEITLSVKQEFGGLTEAQLNLKSAENKWSIAECLDHLIVSNETYLPSFQALLNGTYKYSLWQSLNPLTGFTGKKALDILKADKSKLKAPGIFKPAAGSINGDIIRRFAAQQETMKIMFDRLENAGMHNKVITLPVSSALTIRIGDVLQIITEHERRHLRQAMRVKLEYIK